MTNTYIGLLFLASYLLGGIPTGYIIGRIKGIDIRRHGSGNPGTANVYRTLGKWPGILTFTVDFLKGFAPAMMAKYFFYIEASADFSRGHWWIPVTAGALAIAGHIWTPFHSFHGGKGVATAAGVFMALLPVPTAGAFVVFGVAVAITHHIFRGSMSAAVAAGALLLPGYRRSARSLRAGRLRADNLYAHREHTPHTQRRRAFFQAPQRGGTGRKPNDG